jgi:GAF domain-containing protein
MSSELPKISLIPAAEPNRLFSRDSSADDSAPLPFQVAISRVAHAAASGVQFDELLQEIVVCATRTLGASIGLIRSLSADGTNFVVAAASGPAPLSIGGLIGSYSVVSDEVRRCQPGGSISIDLRSENQSARLTSNERWELAHIGGRYLVAIPLFAGGELVGRLDLIRTATDPFSAEIRNLALPFAAFAASALQNRQIRLANEDSRVFQTVIGLHQSVEQLADPETILQAVVELVVREPGCARCYAMLWNAERGEFVPTAVAGLEPHLVDILKLIALSPQVVPAFDQMVHSSRPLVIADATRSTLLPASLVRALGIRAAMIVPLRGRRHQTTGVLLLDQYEEGVHFTDRQVSMMAGMAQHLSTLIENAILFEEVRTSSDSMSIINEIAIQLAMLTDEDSLFRQLYHQVASIVDASRFAMGLFTSDGHSLALRVAIDGDVLPGPQRVPLGEDPLSTVAISGRAELLGNRTGADTRHWLPGAIPTDESNSHLTVPIRVGRNVIGSLSIQSAFRNAYGPRDKELLAAIALHTGIAIENARLYRIVLNRGDRRAAVLDQVMYRQEVERKELVDDIHDDTLQTLAACLYRLDQAALAVEKLDQQDPVLGQISDVRESLSENIDRLRQRIFALRPATLDRLGLEPALRELLATVRREHAVDTELEIDLRDRLTSADETLVYRLVQEAIDHITGAHSSPAHIAVAVREHLDNVLISIFDDGTRPSDARVAPSDDGTDGVDVALLALIERADLAGGNVRVSRRSSGGSMMQIMLPGHRRGPEPEPGARDPDRRHGLAKIVHLTAEGDHGTGA